MKIISAATAFPPHCYSQQAIAGALKRLWKDRLPNTAVLDRLHANCGVEQRYLTLEIDAYERVETFGASNTLWIQAAQQLGKSAICRALNSANLQPRDIDALFFVSVTGVASPSIDARLINLMGLSRHLKRIPIFGLGCVAGAAGIARAADYVRAYPDQIAVVLSVELCSLTWQRNDLSVANLISCGLFGDGAASVIIAGNEVELPGVQILDTLSVFYPGSEDVMGWDISEEGFRIVLSPDVPTVIKNHLGSDVDGFLARHDLQRSDISSWIIHTGGPKVLAAVESSLDLPPDALAASRQSLRQVGNLSSASVLVVLDDFLKHRRSEAGSYSVLAAMGPGFCSELVLLQW